MQIDSSNGQFSNAPVARCDNFEPGSNVTVERDGHPEKDEPWSVSTAEGMQIDDNAGQSSNGQPSICDKAEPDSNVTVESE
jgi:hypothetical protein